MTFSLYNTATKKIEDFIPIDSNHIKLYLCGPTVYKSPHIGNARSMIIFDVVVRLLKAIYPTVTFVRNVTDIDDKIINQANELKIQWNEVVDDVYTKFKKNTKKLNLLEPDFEPFATHYMKETIEIVQELVANDYAYISEEGVLFDTSKIKDYYALCPNQQLEHGKRVKLTPNKRNDSDFFIWKLAKNLPVWSSPWGKGRAGWHIECTVMSKKLLQFPFDIHGGGQDLIFPHHTNERAQGLGLCQRECAKYWLHNNFLNMKGAKMSKSLGNLHTIESDLQEQNPMVIRLTLLMAHYQHTLNWSEGMVKNAQNIYNKWLKAAKQKRNNDDNQLYNKVITALKSNLNTPLAITLITQNLKTSHADLIKACKLIGIHFGTNCL